MHPAQIDFVNNLFTLESVEAPFFQPLEGNLICCGMHLSIDLVASGQRLTAKIVQGVVPDANHKIVPDELYRALDLAFCLAPVWPAQHRLEAVKSGKVLELPVEDAVLLL